MDSLPDEIKIYILKKLDAKSLKEVSTLSSAWRKLVFNSSSLLDSFTLIVSDPYEKLLEEHGSKFHFVKIHRLHVKINEFKKVLRCISNVRELCIFYVRFKSTPKSSPYKDIHLKQLKNLKLYNFSISWRITNFLYNADMEKLGLVGKGMATYDEDFEPFGNQFLDWFCSRKKLTHLELVLEQNFGIKLFKGDLPLMQFKLKDLKIEQKSSDQIINYAPMVNIFQGQRDLESVTLALLNIPLSTMIYKFVLYDLPSLKGLTMIQIGRAHV